MRWFDPIEEKWHDPQPPRPERELEISEVDSDLYARAERKIRLQKIWEAVVSTATASQMSKETGNEQSDDIN